MMIRYLMIGALMLATTLSAPARADDPSIHDPAYVYGFEMSEDFEMAAHARAMGDHDRPLPFRDGKVPGWLYVFKTPEDCAAWSTHERRSRSTATALPEGWTPADAKPWRN